MKDERYVWDAEFHMKSGNSFKAKLAQLGDKEAAKL